MTKRANQFKILTLNRTAKSVGQSKNTLKHFKYLIYCRQKMMRSGLQMTTNNFVMIYKTR